MGAKPRHHFPLGELADRQHGVVSKVQLTELGYSDAAIARAVQVGRIYRVFRGSYAVGHPGVSGRGRSLAAVLACADEALLSHHSAAWLWGLSPTCPRRPDVTVPRRGHRRSGIQLHHSTILEDEDLAEEDAIPTTAIPRTLLDVAATRRTRLLDGLIEKTERMGLLDLDALDRLLPRVGGHRGRKPLERALTIYRDPIFSRARSERLFRSMVRKAGLPLPQINVFVDKYEIDAYWPNERFAVEIDGWGTHRTRAAFERDPLRIEELKLIGIDAMRITARRLEREPDRVAERIATFLARRRAELGQERGRRNGG